MVSSGPATSATTVDTEQGSDGSVWDVEWDGSIRISVREANELRFLTSHEFYSQRFEAFHEMLRRIDKILTEMGVEPIKGKLEL